MGVLGDRVGRGGCCSSAAPSCPRLARRRLLPVSGSADRRADGDGDGGLGPDAVDPVADPGDVRQRAAAHDRADAWTASFSLGGLLAPVIAGSLVERFWWGSVFLVAGPIVALLLVLGPFLLPRDQALRARLHIVSAVTSLAAVLSAVYGLKRIAQAGLDPVSIAAIVLGGLLAVLFVRRQSRRDDPMVDLGLLRRTASAWRWPATPCPSSCSTAASCGSPSTSRWYSGCPRLSRRLTIPSVLGYLLGATIAPAAANACPRTAPSAPPGHRVHRIAVLAGVTGNHGLALVIAGSVVFSVGLAPVYALTTEIIVASVPPERAGSASAIAETGSELGGASASRSSAPSAWPSTAI